MTSAYRSPFILFLAHLFTEQASGSGGPVERTQALSLYVANWIRHVRGSQLHMTGPIQIHSSIFVDLFPHERIGINIQKDKNEFVFAFLTSVSSLHCRSGRPYPFPIDTLGNAATFILVLIIIGSMCLASLSP